MNGLSSRVRLTAVPGAVLFIALMTGSGVAHHSFAMYDTSTTRTLTGKLTRFVPEGNHAQLIFELLWARRQPLF